MALGSIVLPSIDSEGNHDIIFESIVSIPSFVRQHNIEVDTLFNVFPPFTIKLRRLVPEFVFLQCRLRICFRSDTKDRFVAESFRLTKII